MGRPAAVKQADIERALKAAAASGLQVSEIVIEPASARLKFVAESSAKAEGPQPKQWPSE